MKIHRRSFVTALVATLITGLMSTVPVDAHAAKTVEIGSLQPLTGSLAPFGQNSLNAINLAVQDINAAGGLKGLGGAKLKVVSADAGSSPTTAASAVQRLISRNDVKAVFGAYASSLTLAVQPIVERAQIPLFTMSFSNELLSHGYHYTFMVQSDASQMGQAQLLYAIQIAKSKGQKLNNIAVLYENSAYGTSQAKGLREEAKKLGVNVVLFVGYPPGITDATPLIQKIVHATPKVQAVFPLSYFTDAVLIIRTMHQFGLDVPVIGGAAGYVIPGFKKALGHDVDGILSTDTSNDDGGIGKLAVQYQKLYGKFMTHEAIENAVMVYTYAAAVNKAGTDNPEKVADALHSIKLTGYPFDALPGGGVKFNKAGHNVMTHPIMVQWQHGKLVTVWPKADAKAEPRWP